MRFSRALERKESAGLGALEWGENNPGRQRLESWEVIWKRRIPELKGAWCVSLSSAVFRHCLLYWKLPPWKLGLFSRYSFKSKGQTGMNSMQILHGHQLLTLDSPLGTTEVLDFLRLGKWDLVGEDNKTCVSEFPEAIASLWKWVACSFIYKYCNNPKRKKLHGCDPEKWTFSFAWYNTVNWGSWNAFLALTVI